MEVDYWKLRKEVETHPGFLYRQSRRAHNNSLKIYGGNFRELSKFIDRIENPETYFKEGWHDKKRDELYSELHRFFHNFVAAAESLVSHTRSYIRHTHRSDNVGMAYNDKVKSYFSEHLPTVVIKDFRNYFLHKGLPTSSIQINLPTDGTSPVIEIQFPVERLLAWKQWSSMSKRYLNGEGKKLRLKKLATEYHNNVAGFYRWFDEILNNHHRDEVKEMEKLAARVIALENEMR